MKKFSKDDYLKLHGNPQFISGIHNYCDRWCEHCPKNAFCSVFATEQAFNEMNEDEPDRENNIFALMENMFEITHELIKDMAIKHNFDFEATEEVNTGNVDNLFDAARNHPLATAGENYFKAVDAFFKRNNVYLKEQAEKNFIISGEQGINLSIQDSIDVVGWYCSMIPAKLHRGISTFLEDDLTEQYMVVELYGSLKVALLSTQRSMVALAFIMEKFPDVEDEILPLLIMLERIYKTIVKDFPLTITHVRNGLD